MFHVMLNGEFTLDAEGQRISYASREDAMAAIGYFDLGDDDRAVVMHYLEALEFEAFYNEAIEECF